MDRKNSHFHRNTGFIDELNTMCEYVVKYGKVDFNEIRFKEIFLKYECDTHENIECINELEFGEVMGKNYTAKRRSYGLKVKDTDILISDIAFSLEQNESVSSILAKEYPQLSSKQIDAVQRMITLILLAFECNEQMQLIGERPKAAEQAETED